MAVLILSPNGTYKPRASLAAMATAPYAAGKTIVVTSPQVVTTAIAWPSDRELRFEKGGYVTFTGDGALTGLKEARPEWFGIGAAALAKAFSLSNCRVIVTGVNSISSIVSVAGVSNVTIEAEGAASIIATANMASMLLFTDSTGVTINGVTLDGGGHGVQKVLAFEYSGTTAITAGMDGPYIDRITVQNVSSSTCAYGVSLPWISARNFRITNSKFYNLYATPNSVIGDTNGSVRGVRVSTDGCIPTPAQANIKPTSGLIDNCSFLDYLSTEDSDGVHIQAKVENAILTTLDVKVQNCFFSGMGTSAIKIQSQGVTVSHCTVIPGNVPIPRVGGIRAYNGHCRIKNNVVYTAGTSGIAVGGNDLPLAGRGDYAEVTGNYIEGTGTGVFYGIYLGCSAFGKVSGNVIAGLVQRGIAVRASTDVTSYVKDALISDNTVNAGVQDGLVLTSDGGGPLQRVAFINNAVNCPGVNFEIVIQAGDFTNVSDITVEGGVYAGTDGSAGLQSIQLNGVNVDLSGLVVRSNTARGPICVGSPLAGRGATNVSINNVVYHVTDSTAIDAFVRVHNVTGLSVIGNSVPAKLITFNPVTGFTQTGLFEQGTYRAGDKFLSMPAIASFASNSAAAVAGVPLNGIYALAGALQLRTPVSLISYPTFVDTNSDGTPDGWVNGTTRTGTSVVSGGNVVQTAVAQRAPIAKDYNFEAGVTYTLSMDISQYTGPGDGVLLLLNVTVAGLLGLSVPDGFTGKASFTFTCLTSATGTIRAGLGTSGAVTGSITFTNLQLTY